MISRLKKRRRNRVHDDPNREVAVEGESERAKPDARLILALAPPEARVR